MPSASTSPPADTAEAIREVRAAWTAALGHDAFDDQDDFFDVGGHSLLVARIMARLGEATGGRLPLRLFFDNPTVRGLARAICARTDGTDEGVNAR
ncbi:acyl carrier protein [Streptomyces sp. NPDC004270]